MPDLNLQVTRALRDVLEESGESFDIPGLGKLEARGPAGCLFTNENGPRVFVSYVHEDIGTVRRLRTALDAAGFQPWMDRYEILPGQNWGRAIQRAIRLSDFYIPCFSTRAVRKRGTFQRELRYALRCNEEFPLDDSFVLPVRLEECEIPAVIAANFQYVDLFKAWDFGVAKLERSMRTRMLERRQSGQ